MDQAADKSLVKKYFPLAVAAGIGSMLGSGIIVGLAATITVWQQALALTNAQVGFISGALTFAIAFGSIFGGRLAETVGLTRFFNWINLVYAIGAGIVMLANSYAVLLTGVIITGLASGADLPTSLTVVSHDAPGNKTSSSLVSATQIFWQVGIFISYICSFAVSTLAGATGARIVFAILMVFAVITWLWRTLSHKFKQFHEEADARYAKAGVQGGGAARAEKVSLTKVLFGKDKAKYLSILLAITVFYVGWNLLANTWGQFQTFMLVKAHASQSLATGAGIVLNVIALIVSIIFASVAGGKHRNQAFFAGTVIMLVAMVGLAASTGDLWMIMAAIAFYNLGSPLAGEALYKVWTQESYPVEIRSSVQGLINGFSRICCALFAMITPALVVPSAIKTTMWAFAGIIVISFLGGLVMLRLQKRYGRLD